MPLWSEWNRGALPHRQALRCRKDARPRATSEALSSNSQHRSENGSSVRAEDPQGTRQVERLTKCR